MLYMRKNYVKEIQLMREISYVKPVEETVKKSKIRRTSYNEFDNKLEVFIFNPTEGLEPELCKTFNEYTKRLKNTFESRMNVLSQINQDYSNKLAIYQSQKQASDLKATELIQLAFLRGESVMTIWTEFRRNTTEEDLRQICEREFEELISEITQKTITETVENLNRETTRQVLHLKNKM